jgi:uncharacterized membrane protein YfcA
MSISLIVVALAVLFIAALTKSVLGFGESLVAIPLLTLLIGIQVATPLASLIASSVTLLLIARNWRQIDFAATWRLTLAAVVSVPIGVLGLKRLPEAWTTTALGLFLILIGLFYLSRPTLRARTGKAWMYVFGAWSGVLAGAYNIGGPPIMIYGTIRHWPPTQFRATLQGYFFWVNLMLLASHASAGLWTPQVLQLFALSIPVMLVAFWLGNRIGDRLPTATFERILYMALIVLGVMLII